MPFIATEIASHLNKSYVENEQYGPSCVAYVKKVTKAPPSNTWKKGAKIFNPLNPQCFYDSSITPGVVVATFDENGDYPSSNQHAAIFVRYTTRGFIVQDQYLEKGKVTLREIFRESPDRPKERQNDPNAYFVVETIPTSNETSE